MKQGTWILIAVLVVLGIATYLVLRQPGETSSTGSSGAMLVSYDSASVDRIDIRSGSGTIILEKESGGWMLTSPLRYRADQASATEAIGKGNHIELKNLVSTNAEKQHLFQVDSAGTLVRIYEKGTERAAFRIGKPSSNYMETYVRNEKSSDVYLAEGAFSFLFNRGAKDWRDKTIFKSTAEGITSVTFHYGDTTFALVFQDSTWRINQLPTDQTIVRSFLTALANVSADDFVDTALTSLPKMTSSIDVEGTQIRFYPEAQGGKYYVQTSQTPQWFELQGWRATQVLKRFKDFFPPTSTGK